MMVKRSVAVALLVLMGAAALAGAAVTPDPPRSIRDSPGYYPANDPESASVRIGRRTSAPAVREPFRGGARSLDELGRGLCWAAHHSRADSIWDLAIDEREFRAILWPEFPQSRPATGITADDAWQLTHGRFQAGIQRFLRTYKDEPIVFVRFDRADTIARYRNFRLHNGLTMVIRSADGIEERVDFVRAVAERKGRFKLQGVSD